MSDNTIGFEIENPVSVWNRDIKIDLKSFFATLGKMTVSFISYDGKGVEANLIDLLKDAGLKNNPAQIAWLLIFQSLKQSLVELIEEYQNLFNQTTNDDKLKEFAENIANELNTIKVIITPQFFDRPQDLPLLENLKPALIQWLLNLGLTDIQANTIHARLKTKFVLSLHQQWLAKPIDYAVIKDQIITPFTQANQKLQSWHQYNAWLQEQINQRMFDEAFGLNQVYVPLRAYYHVKEEDCVEHDIERNTDKPKPIVIDLKTHLTEWVNNFNKDDCIRVVSGGPGSGKSSFGKMFAAHIAELKTIPVLFIPLHHFDPLADLISAVNQFVASDRFLTGTPLDAKDGEPSLLLIFDGLDELSMQGKASAEVALAFVDEVITKLDKFNGQGLRRIALLTGRDLAVQATHQRFRKSAQILHVLPYFVEENKREQYQDNQQLLNQDQRDDWWRNYGLATGKTYSAIPDSLKDDELTPITKEPLLNYLVALSFERGKLDFSKQTTLNVIYADLLEAVYQRQYESHIHASIGELTKAQFFLVLEEIALAIWHGDGRTATVTQIQQRCKDSGLSEYLSYFQKSAEEGVTRLLTAFYFRQSDKLQAGDKTFEFTHKSFGEYLTARRIIAVVKHIDLMLKRRKDNPFDGWDERGALEYWAKICGATAIDNYLFGFIEKEIALQPLNDLKDWQSNFIRLIESAVKFAMPMEKLGLNSFQTMMQQSRNSGEGLLVIHYACAKQTEIVSPNPIDLGEWLRHLQGHREGGNTKIIFNCLAYLNLSRYIFYIFDFYEANLQKSNLSSAIFAFACFIDANLAGANLAGANLERAYLERTNIEGANLNGAILKGANLNGAILKGANLEGANLEIAKLQGVNLAGANLERANLERTNLEGANLEGANLISVRGLSNEEKQQIKIRFPSVRI